MVNEQINDLIFKELIKRGYSLEGNTRVWNIADSKLWYLTPEQAQAYLDLEESDKFKELASNMEFELLKGSIKSIKKNIGKNSINVVDLGCGDGKKAAYLIEQIRGTNDVRYCPIDISGYMVNKAIETVSKINVENIIESQWNISDFENLENIMPLLKQGNFKKSLFLLLGHTLGNFEVCDMLYQIRSSMSSGDILIIVNGIGNEKWKRWVEDCKDEEKFKINSFFKRTPLQLGLEDSDIDFGVRLKNSRVEYYYTLTRDKTIDFQNKTIQFNKDDQIIVAVSYKHKKDDLLTILNTYFGAVELNVSKDGSTALALCVKI